MTIQIPLDSTRNLKVFYNSQDVENLMDPAVKPRDDMTARDDTEFIYFARYGKSFDGHKFALKIIRSKNFIAGEKSRIVNFFSNTDEQKEILESKFFISVDNVNVALNHVMKNFALVHNLNFKSIGVTGTSGKTSVVQLAGQSLELLNPATHPLKIGTFGIEIGKKISPNSHVTTPDYPSFISALAEAKNENIDTLIMEVSSHGLAEARLDDYEFDIALFTNFSQDHLDFHKTMEEYFEAKSLLFSKHLKKNGTCIVSTQSPEWFSIAQNAAGTERTLYLVSNDALSSRIRPLETQFKNIFFLKVENKTSDLTGLGGNFHLMNAHKNTLAFEYFNTPIIGHVNFENVMHAFCICHALGHSPQKFVRSFASLSGVPGRMERVTQYGGLLHVIVDYAHKPGALESVLKTLHHLRPHKKKIITVFGCGGNRDSAKRPLMGRVAAELSDIAIITSDNPRHEDPIKIIDDIVSGIRKSDCPQPLMTSSYFVEPDRRCAIQMAFEIAEESDIILIAGKGHETYQTIGNTKIEFSDVEVAREFLRGWIPRSSRGTTR